MKVQKIIEEIRVFLGTPTLKDKLIFYKQNNNPEKLFNQFDIKIKLDDCKDLILQEETHIELGGANKESFSMIYPMKEFELVENGKISLLGSEISNIKEKSVHFGMFILIGVKEIPQNILDELINFRFLSNGIEGFLIRSIPRKFWCRLSKKLIKKGFSFELLGNAILYLYKQKFKDNIESMEIIFINSNSDLIKEFKKITSIIKDSQRAKWKEKIEKWKKNIECDYDWDCKDCPYEEICDSVRDIIKEREKIEE